jgi:hypothetical protein
MASARAHTSWCVDDLALDAVFEVALARPLDRAGIGLDQPIGHRLRHAGVQQPVGLRRLGAPGVAAW